MNNVLFVPTTRDSRWIKELVPDRSPSELPVAGRRIIDYAVEVAEKADAVFIQVLDWDYSEELFNDFVDLTRNASPVFYVRGEGEIPEGLRDIEGLSTPLTQSVSDGLVVVWGPVVPDLAHGEDETFVPLSEEELAHTPTGVYKRIDGKWMAHVPGGLVIRDARAWHLINFMALRHPDRFTLSGYSAEKGVHLGRNVILERGVSVVPPVLLCDDSWCARNVVLDGSVVVGRGSYIGEGTRLVKTVVGDDTIVGDGLVFENKIIMGSRVIDAQTGAWADIEDPGVVRPSGQRGKPGLFKRILNFFTWMPQGRRT
jgi:NDP-sugar pyrophosphorylase family protein